MQVSFLISGGVALMFCLAADADSPPWRETAAFVAPEAKQAAAADDLFVYAIDNSVIAKYDRATRMRIAISAGSARHLNSGFVWEGRLYCAHSNYPQLPEHSEIKVLDPATMKLESWKDFGNYGGSLTWVVRADDRWWCNFARYGADNRQSFLVRFDDQWKEETRFLYPPELVVQLGNYSLSGAVWRNGELLATDHDHERLYRLRLSDDGKTLKYVGTLAAPFSGQGIAADPVTGGLLGIRRKSREVVFAIAVADEASR